MMKKMSTRLTAVFGIMALFFMLMPMVRAEATEKIDTWGDYTYHVLTETDGSKYIILDSYNGDEENLVIPEQINSIHVTYMPVSYKYPDKIKTITLSKNIKFANIARLNHLEKIEVSEQNRYLKSLNGVLFNKKGTELIWYPIAKKESNYSIPNSVTELEIGVFANNQYLEKIITGKKLKIVEGFENSNIQTVVLSDSVEGISEQAFFGCKKLKTVIMGKNVRWIGEEAFKDCISLSNITFSSNLVKIYARAFENCKSLNKKLTIPATVYSIESDAFKRCPAKLKMSSYMKWQKNKQRYRAYVNVRNLKTGKTKSYSIASMEKLRPVYQTVTIKKGKSKKIQVYAYKDNKKLGIADTGILAYTSSNPKIAKVSKYGNVKAYKKGKVTIKVDFRPQMTGTDNRKKYCYITIKVK